MVEVGRVMWSDSHNPRATAHIDNRRCWDSVGADGNENLCDLVVSYNAGDKSVTTSMQDVEDVPLLVEVKRWPQRVQAAA